MGASISTLLERKERSLAVLGLGYVGLPLALEFAKHYHVIGFDVDSKRLDLLRNSIDPSRELTAEAFEHVDIEFTADLEQLREASFFIVAVPTPIDESNTPDLGPLLSATRSVAQCLQVGDYVCFESTVYPGCTEEECVPLLESVSGLSYKTDFSVGYSPERINPGDRVHRLDNTVKVVSACSANALEEIAKVYERIVKAGTYRASSIKVAEASKIIENTQRDVNIALMNELSILFSRLDINTFEVIEAAGTKWNFLKFYPGLVGGHCIGVDPYYLVHKAYQVRYHTKMISAGRFINDSMGGYIGKRVVKQLIEIGLGKANDRILVLGITFKENVADIRNSKAFDIVKEIQEYGYQVDVMDPYASSAEVQQQYKVRLTETSNPPYSAVIVAVAHQQYAQMSESDFERLLDSNGLLVDVKGIYRKCIHKLHYWSL